MESKAALVGEDVERVAVGIAGGGGVVFALVEKSSRLLARSPSKWKRTPFSWKQVAATSPKTIDDSLLGRLSNSRM